MGVIERGERLRLALEPRQAVGIRGEDLRQDLDRHLPIELRVARPLDLPHPACSERAEDFVRAHPASRNEPHGKVRTSFEGPAIEEITGEQPALHWAPLNSTRAR